MFTVNLSAPVAPTDCDAHLQTTPGIATSFELMLKLEGPILLLLQDQNKDSNFCTNGVTLSFEQGERPSKSHFCSS